MSELKRPTLKAFCLDWHLDRSAAARVVLVDPLRPYCDVELVAWDGDSLSGHTLDASSPVIFFQLPPPRALIEELSAKVVWIPMWDQAKGYDDAWWGEMPKRVRVVSFSSQIALRAQAAGLQLLNLRYFPDPDDFRPVTWDRGSVLFYWNRTGIAGPPLLRKLCRAIGARELIYRPELDPRIDPRMQYELPTQLGDTKVTTIAAASRDEYLRATGAANVFLAPRAVEGVGLTFLEAMARGGAVVAYDAPTMNEYIRDGENGILLTAESIARGATPVSRFKETLFADRNPHLLSHRQDWASVKAVDLEAVGRQARAECRVGQMKWREDIQSYASFVCDW
jgi:hypothetical protein